MSAVGSILTNTGALDALQSISTTSTENNTLEGEMSSGLSISSPASNPAGYITAQGFTSQLNGLTQAISNANQGVSLLQTATGALQQQIGVVQQLNSIAVQAANGTETSNEGASLQSVVSQLTSQISNIASQTQFNNVSLLNGTFNNVQFQVGSNEGQTMNLSIGDTSASALGMYQTGGMASTVDTGGSMYKTAPQTSTMTGVMTATPTSQTAVQASQMSVPLTYAQLGSGAGGVLTAGSKVGVSIGGTPAGSVTVNKSLESAASLATSLGALPGVTGATATTTSSLAVTGPTGAGTAAVSFSLVASGSGKTVTGKTAETVSGTSAGSLATSINGQSAETGITATVNTSNGDLVLTQSAGDNIQISAYSMGSASGASIGSISGATGVASASSNGYMSIQGSVQLSAASPITTTNGGNMLAATSTPTGPGMLTGPGELSTTTPITVKAGGTTLGSVTPTSSLESAASLAASLSALSGVTGATATTTSSLAVTPPTGTGTGAVSFSLVASGGGMTVTGKTAETVSGTSAASLATSINGQSADTGITASVNTSNGDLVLTQSAGDNIQISAYSMGSANGASISSISGAAANSVASNVGYMSIQGTVQLSGASDITTTGGATMVGATSALAPGAGLTATNLADGTGGAAAAFNISLGGNSLGTVTPTNSLESAASLASQVNSMDGAKGITASASNVVNLGKLGGGTTGDLTLTLAASGSGKTIGAGVQATGSSMTSLVASINHGTSDTGISATTNSAGSLILSQASGENIQLSGYSAAANGPTLAAASAASGSNYVAIQGGVQLAGASEISATATTATPLTMVSGTSSFTSLADVNVSTVNGTTPADATGAQLNTQGGANQAISVVNYALDSLNNSGGQLGAVQEGLTANINNLSTTSENVTSALGVVQDANLPQVANQLTQAQIQAQAGVAALKSSTTLQQSYLSLLP